MSLPPKAPPVYKPTVPKLSAPPVYRPEPLGARAQLKPASNFRVETRSAPPVYRPQQMGNSHSLPAKEKLQLPKEFPKSLPVRYFPSARGAVQGRPLFSGTSVLQRMEEKSNDNNSGREKNWSYTSFSVCKGGSSNDRWRWISNDNSQRLQIKDTGNELQVFINDEKVGFVTYKEDREEGERRLIFKEIDIYQKHRGKKLSSAVLFCLAIIALERGIQLVASIHPDPDLRSYWEKMGFDYAAGQNKFFKIQKELYEGQLAQTDYAEYQEGLTQAIKELSPTKVKPTEIVASTAELLQRSQESFRKEWK